MQADYSGLFERIYRKYYRRIYNYVYMRLPQRETAEDVTADIFFTIFCNLERFDATRGNFVVWLYVIARNTVRNYINSAPVRYEKNFCEVPEKFFQSNEAGTIANPLTTRIQRILERLSDKERELLTLIYDFELTNKEIAELYGENAATIRQRHHRLLIKCRRIDSEL